VAGRSRGAADSTAPPPIEVALRAARASGRAGGRGLARSARRRHGGGTQGPRPRRCSASGRCRRAASRTTSCARPRPQRGRCFAAGSRRSCSAAKRRALGVDVGGTVRSPSRRRCERVECRDGKLVWCRCPRRPGSRSRRLQGGRRAGGERLGKRATSARWRWSASIWRDGCGRVGGSGSTCCATKVPTSTAAPRPARRVPRRRRAQCADRRRRRRTRVPQRPQGARRPGPAARHVRGVPDAVALAGGAHPAARPAALPGHRHRRDHAHLPARRAAARRVGRRRSASCSGSGSRYLLQHYDISSLGLGKPGRPSKCRLFPVLWTGASGVLFTLAGAMFPLMRARQVPAFDILQSRGLAPGKDDGVDLLRGVNGGCSACWCWRCRSPTWR
jgi:hypothetical protein